MHDRDDDVDRDDHDDHVGRDDHNNRVGHDRFFEHGGDVDDDDRVDQIRNDRGRSIEVPIIISSLPGVSKFDFRSQLLSHENTAAYFAPEAEAGQKSNFDIPGRLEIATTTC